MRRRLPAMSKMPPEDLQAALQLRQAFPQRTDFHGAELSTSSSREPSKGSRALRARYLGPGFEPTDFGLPKPKEVFYDVPTTQLKPRAAANLREENAQLHKTAAAAAQDARGMERLMERKRWSNVG